MAATSSRYARQAGKAAAIIPAPSASATTHSSSARHFAAPAASAAASGNQTPSVAATACAAASPSASANAVRPTLSTSSTPTIRPRDAPSARMIARSRRRSSSACVSATNSPSADAAISSSAKPRTTSMPTPNTLNRRADSYAGAAACSTVWLLIARGRLAAASGLLYLTNASVTSRAGLAASAPVSAVAPGSSWCSAWPCASWTAHTLSIPVSTRRSTTAPVGASTPTTR